jgi:divalent metal cation (Fe/Co/Zn/Cd) transporter
LHAIVREDAAIEQVLSLGAVDTGPESAVVIAKVHPSAGLNVEQLTRAMDDFDHRIRLAVPLIADVFIDVTARRQKQSEQPGELNGSLGMHADVWTGQFSTAPRKPIPRW